MLVTRFQRRPADSEPLSEGHPRSEESQQPMGLRVVGSAQLRYQWSQASPIDQPSADDEMDNRHLRMLVLALEGLVGARRRLAPDQGTEPAPCVAPALGPFRPMACGAWNRGLGIRAGDFLHAEAA